MVSYPNQRFVTIHKEPYFQDFMQVAKDEWMPAFADLTRGTFGLYLYLCGNMDNYRFALSSVAVQQAIGVSDSTYRRGVEELLEKGYLIIDGNEHNLHFYPSPQPTTYVSKKNRKGAAAPVTNPPALVEEDWGEEALEFIASQRKLGA